MLCLSLKAKLNPDYMYNEYLTIESIGYYMFYIRTYIYAAGDLDQKSLSCIYIVHPITSVLYIISYALKLLLYNILYNCSPDYQQLLLVMMDHQYQSSHQESTSTVQ